MLPFPLNATALKIGLIALAIAALVALRQCDRNDAADDREGEINAGTAETVETVREQYDEIDETRARDGDDAAVDRLRDGTFLLDQGPGGAANLPDNRPVHQSGPD